MLNPEFLEGDHFFSEMDFANEFHRVMFGTVYNLHQEGTEHITVQIIEDYLRAKDRSFGIYKANKGAEWVKRAMQDADPLNFEYYYGKLKKMTLLRQYSETGVDISWLYDPDNIADLRKRELQERNLDKLTLEQIADRVDDRVLSVREEFVDNSLQEAENIGRDLSDLIQSFETTPAVGLRLFDWATNSVFMGARLGKFYVRSASTGTGKSRSAMADACNLACREIYNPKTHKWEQTGNNCQPTMFISVELDYEELKTMAVAFVSCVPEGNIIKGECSFDEKRRVQHAVEVLEEAPLKLVFLPDYGIKEVENSIKVGIRRYDVKYVFFDYITTSMKIINEISMASNGMKIREDNVLFLLASKLKDIASSYGVCIFSATQLNNSYHDAKIPDQGLLAGAKAIANRVDVGAIMMDVTSDDLERLASLPDYVSGNLQMLPNVKMSVYKNRRGEYTRCYLWMLADKATCRYETLFLTDYDYKPIDRPEDVRVIVEDDGGREVVVDENGSILF